MFSKIPTIYIGWDSREPIYYDVLRYSILKHSSIPLNIVPLVQDSLRRTGLYWRSYTTEGAQKVDVFDGKPFSTEFSFSRFLVPHLQQFSGQALFMDCDMFVRADIAELFKYPKTKGLYCVKHEYKPPTSLKMDGQRQENYHRKNWSSLMLWNCEHPAHHELTVSDVNNSSGSYLHSFSWMDYNEIGSLPEEWNWLDGHSAETIKPKNVHFTTGGPFYDDWKGSRNIDEYYASEWVELREEMFKAND